MLKKAESVYYPPAIRPSSSLDPKANPVSSDANVGQGNSPKAPLATNTSSKEAKQAEDTAKLGDINKGVVQGADLPPTAQKISLRKKKPLKAWS